MEKFDPSGMGKKEPPKEERLIFPVFPVFPAEVNFVQTRGCGDPACGQCNPETARMVNPTNRFETLEGVSGTAYSALFAQNPYSDFVKILTDLGVPFEGNAQAAPPPPAQPKPPPSYAEARKAVEQWIAPAPTQAFDDIVGNEQALEQLRDAIQAPVKHAELYTAYGMTMPRGALLSGPPGCGKTMFARAAASEMRTLHGEATEFISVAGSELQEMYVGQTEKHIKAIFAFAREYAAFHKHPLLVFVDEAEVILPDRTGRIRRVAPWEESQVAAFLAEMDGIQTCGAFVLLATNRPEVIDSALLRDGRCDFKITVQRPNREAIEAILAKNFAKTLVIEEDRAALVNAALESLLDPHKVITAGHAIKVDLGKRQVTNPLNRHFLLEHIISGAMVASVPRRATAHAFARDKATGVAKGVTVADVVRAVGDLFEENKRLDHGYAMREFEQQMRADLEAGA